MLSAFFIAVMFGVGVGTWAYTKLVKANGNPDPKGNYIAASIVALLAFTVIYTFMKFVLNFE